jgi:hypothetical protein
VERGRVAWPRHRPKGEKAAETIDQLGCLAVLGFAAAMGQVLNVWEVTPLEVLAAEVIPAVSIL